MIAYIKRRNTEPINPAPPVIKIVLLLKSDFIFLKLKDTSRLLNTFISLKVWEFSERTPVQPNKFSSSDKVFL